MDFWCDSGLCGDHVTWELLGDILFIDGEGKMDDYLPNKSVWEPLAWLVRSVVIGKGVTSIGNYAFSSFTKLTGISIPETVAEIGDGAFDSCTGLKEITVSDRSLHYAFRDGMLIARKNGLPIWPPEKAGQPTSWFAINDNDCIFRIETGLRDISRFGGIASFGDMDTLIEIRESCGMIVDIECIYLSPTLHEPNLFLPDYRCNPELEETEFFNCPDYEYEVRHPCVVNVVRDRMEMIFSEDLDSITRYHVEGRVEYYCNDQGDVGLIRISDLSEQEYNFLR